MQRKVKNKGEENIADSAFFKVFNRRKDIGYELEEHNQKIKKVDENQEIIN